MHKSCRCSYAHKKSVQTKLKRVRDVPSPQKRRHSKPKDSSLNPQCLFCDRGEKRLSKGRGVLIPVRTMQFQKTVLEKCESRADSWAQKVKAKIEFVQDCVASDMVYHGVCYTNFHSGLEVPKVFLGEEPLKKKVRLGRPEDKLRLDAFSQVTQYLDSLDAVQVTIRDLVEVMETFLKDSECQAYSPTFMKSKFIEHYGDEIVFAQSSNQADVISLKKTADVILRDFHKEARQSDPEAEKKRLIKAAAYLIRSDILLLDGSKDTYPDTEAIKDHLSFVPQSLQTFLRLVIKKDCCLKISAIGQSIIQSTRPNTIIAPLQFGLGLKVLGSLYFS